MSRSILFMFLSMFFYCCSNRVQESVVFTTSFFMNPDEPRFGIEIKGDTLFYCEEVIEKPGSYTYYYCNYDNSKIKAIQERIKSAFDGIHDSRQVDDATTCELIIIKGNDSIVNTFYLEELTTNQGKVINDLILLKNCKLKKMGYRRFPENLHKGKLPEPPQVESVRKLNR